MPARSLLTWVLVLPVAGLIALQLIPYGRDHSVPGDGPKPAWDNTRTAELAKRACYDCHSNETRWPWYSNIAPISWRVFRHVQEGREHLNFSAFDTANEDVTHAAGEAGESVTKRSMPPADYLLAHPEARLSAEERRALAAGLEATFAAFAEGEHGGGKGELSAREGAGEHAERGEREDEEQEHRGRGRGSR